MVGERVQLEAPALLRPPEASFTTVKACARVSPRCPTNGTYQLIMQGDGNLVIYNPGAIWSTKTNGHAGAYLVLQTDGNLVIYDSSGAIWASGTNGNPGDFSGHAKRRKLCNLQLVR